MYHIKENGYGFRINKTIASKKIGVSREYLTDVLNGKKDCSKILAFCITKYINPNAEINDIFDTIKED